MVSSFVLVNMRMNGIIEFLSAVHIDYGNREVSREEAKFVESWCMYYNIPLITRRVCHIKRNSTPDRNLYETETEKMRFNLYRLSGIIYDTKTVFLGHIKDDISENIIFNMIDGKSILNLDTIREIASIYGIMVARPLLKHEKKTIIDFAHNRNIPYLKNTTPSDCRRGIFREKIIQLLEQLNPCYLENIISVGMSSKELKEYIHTNSVDPILASVNDRVHGSIFPLIQDALSRTCWETIFTKYFHSRKKPMISKKSLDKFMQWMTRRSNIFTLNKHFYCFSDEKQLVIVEKKICNSSKNVIDVPKSNLNEEQNSYIYDIWEIKINIGCEAKTEHKSITTNDFLDGRYSYTYNTCSHNFRNIYISYHFAEGDKSSDTHSNLSGNKYTQYLPKIYMGVPCSECYKNPLKIAVSFSVCL